MKKIICFLLFFGTSEFFAQDTIRHTLGTNFVLRSNKTIRCKDCYLAFENEKTGKIEYRKQEMALEEVLPNLKHEVFYPDGTIKERGMFCNCLHEVYGTANSTQNGAYVSDPVYHSETLKDGIWEYFHPNGNVDRREHYREGLLMFFEEFQY
jgi:antitoxin component YwqK of YwqJK toxin-antitoxin module